MCRIYKEFIWNHEKMIDYLKMGKYCEIAFQKGGCPNSQWDYEKVLNIIHDQNNVN